jgi:pimeloyl-ACP methyl ester carboxylesterase
MLELRKYGNAPLNVAVIHGGPGARGEMAAVARELAKTRGVLEPLQAALTIDGEVEELRRVLVENTVLPMILVGHSWGAWLSLLLAACYPALVSKLILVSSAPFNQEYAFGIDRMRLERLNTVEREEVGLLKAELDNPTFTGDKNILMERVGKLLSRSDSFDSLPHANETECRWDIFSAVWKQAVDMRRSGALLEMTKNIKCPVAAIHGDYDPHPAEGVRIPLSGALKDFRFFLLGKCGHVPWYERQASGGFYEILNKEIG